MESKLSSSGRSTSDENTDGHESRDGRAVEFLGAVPRLSVSKEVAGRSVAGGWCLMAGAGPFLNVSVSKKCRVAQTSEQQKHEPDLKLRSIWSTCSDH